MWLDPGDTVLASVIIKDIRTVGAPTLPAHKWTRWWQSPKGRIWRVQNRAKRNAYFRKYYAENAERRRYLRMKCREYRAR